MGFIPCGIYPPGPYVLSSTSDGPTMPKKKKSQNFFTCGRRSSYSILLEGQTNPIKFRNFGVSVPIANTKELKALNKPLAVVRQPFPLKTICADMVRPEHQA